MHKLFAERSLPHGRNGLSLSALEFHNTQAQFARNSAVGDDVHSGPPQIDHAPATAAAASSASPFTNKCNAAVKEQTWPGRVSDVDVDWGLSAWTPRVAGEVERSQGRNGPSALIIEDLVGFGGEGCKQERSQGSTGGRIQSIVGRCRSAGLNGRGGRTISANEHSVDTVSLSSGMSGCCSGRQQPNEMTDEHQVAGESAILYLPESSSPGMPLLVASRAIRPPSGASVSRARRPLFGDSTSNRRGHNFDVYEEQCIYSMGSELVCAGEGGEYSLPKTTTMPLSQIEKGRVRVGGRGSRNSNRPSSRASSMSRLTRPSRKHASVAHSESEIAMDYLLMCRSVGPKNSMAWSPKALSANSPGGVNASALAPSIHRGRPLGWHDTLPAAAEDTRQGSGQFIVVSQSCAPGSAAPTDLGMLLGASPPSRPQTAKSTGHVAFAHRSSSRTQVASSSSACACPHVFQSCQNLPQSGSGCGGAGALAGSHPSGHRERVGVAAPRPLIAHGNCRREVQPSENQGMKV